MSDFSTESIVKANKTHRCCECHGAISPGEKYERTFLVYEAHKFAFRAYRHIALMDKRRKAFANAYNAETVKIRERQMGAQK